MFPRAIYDEARNKLSDDMQKGKLGAEVDGISQQSLPASFHRFSRGEIASSRRVKASGI